MGFTVVEPGLLPFEQQVQLFARARVVVGAHGAGLTNTLWSPPGIDVIELLPEQLPDPGYRFLANFCGHRHHAVMCENFEHPLGVAYSDISVNIELLRDVLSEVL
jgi:capsular polysaccharide biosynthesis protein